MKIIKTKNNIDATYMAYFSATDFMCSVLNFEYRSVCGINTLPSQAKLA